MVPPPVPQLAQQMQVLDVVLFKFIALAVSEAKIPGLGISSDDQSVHSSATLSAEGSGGVLSAHVGGNRSLCGYVSQRLSDRSSKGTFSGEQWVISSSG